jgi:hypothetical protein
MADGPDTNTTSNTTLHETLKSLGKSWLLGSHATRQKQDGYQTHKPYEDYALTDKMQAMTVQQITTSLRMQGVAGDDDSMLASLETLVLAGEIPFNDFIGRVQNLFPKALDRLDVTLRMKIASQML